VSAQRPRFLFSKRSATTTTIHNGRSLAVVAVKRPSLAAAVAWIVPALISLGALVAALGACIVRDGCTRRSPETKQQDARLNENYKRLMSKLSEERKKAFLEAQRAWIRFRDANCTFWDDPAGGQSAAVTAKECILTMTADRASELELADDQ
jgi:uncharacterized protein YecT (DUF1311 family)